MMEKLRQWCEKLAAASEERERTEIGKDPDGQMSEERLKQWAVRSALCLGVCVAASCALALVASARNKKDAAILEVDFGEVIELVLNRKGTVLRAEGDAVRKFRSKSLEEGAGEILERLYSEGELAAGTAVIFTLRPAEGGIPADLERFAEKIGISAEQFLRKKHSDGTVYVKVLEGSEADMSDGADGGRQVSLGKTMLVRNLIDKNPELKLSDRDRYLAMSPDQISAEIFLNGYRTSFYIITAKQVYAEKAVTETGKEKETEPETEVAEDVREEDFAAEQTKDTPEAESMTEEKTSAAEMTPEPETAPEPTVGPEPAAEPESTAEPGPTAGPEATAGTEAQETAGGIVTPESGASPQDSIIQEVIPLS